jgi:acyl-CoA synthetase (AMP-forming)/AMP-acid ligase II
MMNSEISKVPEYQIPDSGLQFLASENELYDYRNLYSFAVWFKNIIEPLKVSEKRPLLIFDDSSDQQVFTIAACWLLQIPFFPLSPAMTDPEIGNVLGKISPAAVVTDSDTETRFGDLPVIQIPKDKLSMMKIVDESQFSSGHPEKCLGYFLTSGSTATPRCARRGAARVASVAAASRVRVTLHFAPPRRDPWPDRAA